MSEDSFLCAVQCRKKEPLNKDHILNLITELLSFGIPDEKYRFTSKNEKNKDDESYHIRPALDDRMFVCCLVLDDTWSHNLSKVSYLEGWNERILKSSDKSKSVGAADETQFCNKIYKFVNIETTVSCQETEMKKEILKRSIYPRFLNYGTLYAATDHSLVSITGTDKGNYYTVVRPFLSQYIQLAMLSLAERATLLLLSSKAAETVIYLEKFKSFWHCSVYHIKQLQMRYTKAQSQLLLQRLSTEEQGIEIFDLLKRQMYLLEDQAQLDNQMNNLRDTANIMSQTRLNWMILVFTILSLIATVLSQFFHH